jgi:hypothetical protein
MRLTTAQLEEVAGMLEGTCREIETALDLAGLESCDFDVTDIEDQLLDVSLERCKGCDWWMEPSELVDDENEQAGFCEQCREEK